MNGPPAILRLDKSGQPLDWMSVEQAVCLIVKEQIAWSLGANAHTLHGGIDGFGVRSSVAIPAIIATEGQIVYRQFAPTLVADLLFRRDQDMCLYCGKSFVRRELTKDHVVPRAHGGANSWTNVVAACRRCNHRKGARTPEQANMPLLAVPYEPNQYEFMAFANRRILADQMEFLKHGFSKNCQLA